MRMHDVRVFIDGPHLSLVTALQLLNWLFICSILGPVSIRLTEKGVVRAIFTSFKINEGSVPARSM